MRKWIFLAVFTVGLLGCAPKNREALQIKQAQEQPAVKVWTQNGVILWRIYDVEQGQTVYFTTPAGDVKWTVPGDDDNPPKHFQVPGVKK